MSDDPTPTHEGENTEGEQQSKLTEDSTDWKAEARKWEARAKENKGAAEKLREFEDRDKTEAQKKDDRIAELERENASYKHRDQIAEWSADVAKESPELAPLLRGSTREELEEHYTQLSSLTKKPTPKAKPGGKSPEQRDKPMSAAEAMRAMRRG